MGTGRVVRGGIAVATTVVVAACATSGARPRVLGEAIAASTTAPARDGPPAAVPTVPSTTDVPAATEPPASAPTAPVAARPAPPVTTTTAAPPATVAGESMAPGTYAEATDQANTFFVNEDGTTRTSAVEVARRDAAERADVTVMYHGRSVEVQLTNLADRTILLPDGFRAAVVCRRDGAAWRTGEAVNPAVTSVDRGGTVSTLLDLPADGPGEYGCTATVTIVLP